jgi:hypothetical protein
MKIEIKSRWDASVLFSVETDSLKLAVEAAIKSGAYLAGAYLEGAKFPLQIGGHRHWLITTPEGKLQIGCHVHTFESWLEHAEKVGKAERYSALDIEIYKLHIAHLAQVSKLLWNAKEEK